MNGDTINISAETYASTFPACKPGERVTGTYDGVVSEPDAGGGYSIELDAITKEPAGPEEPREEAVEPVDESMSPAARAVMSRGGKSKTKQMEMA